VVERPGGRRRLVLLLLAGVVGAAVGCSDGSRRYPLRGVVQAMLPDGQAEVAHEDIPGFRYYGKAWAKDRGRGRHHHFELASGSAEQVRAAADFFGVSFWNEAGQIVHSFCTAVIGADGRLAASFDGNEWTADELLREVRSAVAQGQGPRRVS
jgi:hypothetical protein